METETAIRFIKNILFDLMFKSGSSYMPTKILRWPKQRPFLNLTSKLDKNQKKNVQICEPK